MKHTPTYLSTYQSRELDKVNIVALQLHILQLILNKIKKLQKCKPQDPRYYTVGSLTMWFFIDIQPILARNLIFRLLSVIEDKINNAGRKHVNIGY